MARTNKVEVEIVAIDEASPKIDKLTKKIDGLEADEARVIVTSNIERLDKQLTDALYKLHQLDGDEATVQARLVGGLEDDMIAAAKLFEQLDGQTGTVTLKADTTQAVRSIDDLGRSAGSSKSVLANMVGNTTQDLGAMGGVAGSAGVAIGQMGEYMADARADGESFSVILRNFATVAGPIAAVSVGLAAVNDIMKAMATGQAATKAFDTKQVEQFTEAVDKGGSVIRNYNETLAETGAVLADVGQKAGPAWTQIIPGVDQITDSLGLFGKFGEIIENILPLLNRAGVSSRIWTEIITSDEPVAAMERLRAALDQTNLSDDDRHKILIAAKAAQDNYADSIANTTEVEAFFGKETKKSTDAVGGLTGAIKRGIEITDDYLQAKQDLIDKIREQVADERAAGEAALQMADDFQAAIQRTVELKVEASKAGETLDDLAGSIDDLEASNLADALDAGDAPLDTLTNVQKINDEIRSLAEFLKDPKGLAGRIPDIFDPNDVDASAFLSKIASLRGPIQAEVARTFGESGGPAAEAMAESFVQSLATQTGLTASQIRTLLGLDDLKAEIEVSIRQSALDVARRQLELLTGLGGVTPYTASIALALDAGTIDPRQAQLLIQNELRNFGVVVPSEVAVPDTTAARRDAQAALDRGDPLTIPARVGLTADQMERIVNAGGSIPTSAGRAPSVVNNTINNPPGTPAATYDQWQMFVVRNGERTQL